MLRKMSEWWVALAAFVWIAYTLTLMLLSHLDVISLDTLESGFIAKYLVLGVAVAGGGIWAFIVWIKETPPATEQQLISRVLKVIVGAFALVGFASIASLLDKTLSQWEVLAVYALSLAAFYIACGAIRLYVRWRDRHPASWPSP